jgi:glycosyltransferase involved in cell wall biosynthesis
MTTHLSNRSVVFVINHVAFFASHRLPIALAARSRGWSVALITGQRGSSVMEAPAEQVLRMQRIPHWRTHFTPSGMNPLREAAGAFQVFSHLLRIRPDVVHCASAKGIVVGGIAARILRVPRVVLAMSGMGFAFTDGHSKRQLRRVAFWFINILGRLAMGNPRARIVVQNADDAMEINRIIGSGARNRVKLIPGSGVDVSSAQPIPMHEKKRLVLLPARVVRDKGIGEFAEAAITLRRLHPDWRFVVAGSLDYENPSSFSASEIERWHQSGAVEFVGYVTDIAPLMAAASIVCLPSYREGMPKALLDAAAWGCAIVTTDVPGCRDAVEANVTGLLVPARNAGALANALEALITDATRRAEFGTAGRRRAEQQFALPAIVNQLIDLYNFAD